MPLNYLFGCGGWCVNVNVCVCSCGGRVVLFTIICLLMSFIAKIPGRKQPQDRRAVHRKCVHADKNKNKVKVEAFMTQGGGALEEEEELQTGLQDSDRDDMKSDDEQDSLQDLYSLEEPKKKMEIVEIQVELYKRECRQLNVTPVGTFLRDPSSPLLNIRHYSLGPRDALALSVPLTLTSHITHLNLEGNGIGGEGLKYLELCLQESCCITHLNVSHNLLGSEGASVLGRVLNENRVLVSLSVAANGFKDVDAVHFSQPVMDKRPISELDLSHNEFGDAAASLFAEALENNEVLVTLDLSWNHIRPPGAVALMKGLKENVGLKHLLLGRNGVGEAGCLAAGEMLAVNSCLRTLDLSANRITDKGLMAIAKGLNGNDTLADLKVGDNLVTGQGAQVLMDLILQSETCVLTNLDLTNVNIFDTMLEQVKAHAQTRPLKLLHGTVSRCIVPRDELERRFADEISAKYKHDEDGGEEKEVEYGLGDRNENIDTELVSGQGDNAGPGEAREITPVDNRDEHIQRCVQKEDGEDDMKEQEEKREDDMKEQEEKREDEMKEQEEKREDEKNEEEERQAGGQTDHQPLDKDGMDREEDNGKEEKGDSKEEE